MQNKHIPSARSRAIALLVGLGLSLTCDAWAEAIVLQPRGEDGKDISLYERTDVELSTSKSLYALNTGPPGDGFDDFTSLLEFDLASVPNVAIDSAKLWLYENGVPTFSFQHVSPSLTNTVQLNPAAAAWNEDSVYYSSLPDPVAGYSVSTVVNDVNTWFSWDVTDVVASWITGELANHGLLVTSTVEVRDGLLVVGAAFDASEQPNAPYLEIELMNLQPGDYNRDGFVDEEDYLQWRDDYGSNAPGSDGNGDGVVNAADYTVWRDNRTADPQATVAIPEPEGETIVAAACVLLAMGVGPRFRRTAFAAAASFAMLAPLGATAAPVSISFTEDFTVSGANWRQNDASLAVTYIPTGGVGGAGDGYVSVERTFTANPSSAQTVFRGHDAFDASGDSFAGDWKASGVSEFSFYVRHNAPTELTFGTRFATSANSPGANVALLDLEAPPNEWTRIAIPITATAIAAEGPPSFFDTVFQNLGNLQISARPGDNLGTPITFDLDRVSIVPEPTSLSLIGVTAVCVAWRRRR